MATAEGTLVASTSRGAKALNAGGGVTTVLTADAMTRGPAIDFPSIVEAARARAWIASPEGHGATFLGGVSSRYFRGRHTSRQFASGPRRSPLCLL
jgi:hydroxymethylglutaryl-CoA reductase